MNDDWPESLVEIARERIAAGTVSMTRYGVRVECCDEFGDNRAEARAYWPGTVEEPTRCRCWQASAHDGLCSHTIAARLYETENAPNPNPYAVLS